VVNVRYLSSGICTIVIVYQFELTTSVTAVTHAQETCIKQNTALFSASCWYQKLSNTVEWLTNQTFGHVHPCTFPVQVSWASLCHRYNVKVVNIYRLVCIA